VANIHKEIKGQLSAQQQCKYEAPIDKEIIAAKLQAEGQCQKIRAGQYGWTQELTQAIQLVLYWKGMQKEKRGKVGKEILK